MAIELRPAGIRDGWQYGESAADEVRSALTWTEAAAGSDLGPLQDCLSAAASDVHGSLQVVASVLREFGAGIEECIADFEATDGASAGAFNSLTGPGGGQ